MPKRYVLLLLLTGCMPLLRAQDAQPTTRAAKFLSHFDLGVAGTAFFTKDVSGTVSNSALPTTYPVTQSASSAAGVLVTLRGSKSPYKGGEFNYGYGRVTENYTCCNLSNTNGAYVGPFASQATANEFTVGYLAKPPHPVFGFQPFVSVGAGTYEFKPTRNGGQGLRTQARALYYYSVGAEGYLVGDTLGLRAGLRQQFYKAPDFGQNYLTIQKYTFTFEPVVGLYLHF